MKLILKIFLNLEKYFYLYLEMEQIFNLEKILE